MAPLRSGPPSFQRNPLSRFLFAARRLVAGPTSRHDQSETETKSGSAGPHVSF
jgi:hypothetical protein